MDEIRCSIEVREIEGVNRLVGVLMPYGERAKDRAELFEVGSLSWDDPKGIVVNRMHKRSSPIMRVVPIEVDGRLTVDTPIPSTAAGLDALAEIRSGLLTSLSVEFRAIRQSTVAGVRRISQATLWGAALVDAGSYESATVEARARVEAAAIRDREALEFLL